MNRGRRLLPSPALVVACIALLLALGGTSYAAFKLPRNSVTSINVKDRSLLAKDLSTGAVRVLRGRSGAPGPQGPQGPAGPAGPTGPAGPSGASSMKWALFLKDGTVSVQNSDVRLEATPSTGSYIVNVGGPARGKGIFVSSSFGGGDLDARGAATASPCGGPPEGIVCPSSNDANHVWVFTYSPDGAPERHAFYLAVIG